MKKIILAVLVVMLTLGFFPVGVKAQSNLWPDPWLTIVGGLVQIGGKPAPAGTLVQFYCRGNLAGEGYTIDVPDKKGLLPLTHVYGSDLTAVPQMLQCEEGDVIDIFVNYVRAVYSPQLRWSDDKDIHMINVASDFEAKFLWSGGEDNEAVPAIGRIAQRSSLKTVFTDGTVLEEKIESVPFWRNLPLNDVKTFVATAGKQDYVYSTYAMSVCSRGPEFSIAQGGGLVRVEVLNTTGQEMQAVLRLQDTMNPAGNLLPGGGLSSMTSNLWGELEVRTPDGQLCAEVVWDFRPAKKIFLPYISR